MQQTSNNPKEKEQNASRFFPQTFPNPTVSSDKVCCFIKPVLGATLFLFNNQKINEAPYESVMIAFPQNIAD